MKMSSTLAFAELRCYFWDIIRNPVNAIDGEAMKAKMDHLGLKEMKELVYLHDEDTKEFASLLKQIPKRKFAWMLLDAAVLMENISKINLAVDIGADVNFLSDKLLPEWNERTQKGTGNSALHLACWLGLDRAIVDRLLELGSDIHLKSLDDGYLPIHIAAKRGKAELVELLLDKGCDPNAKDKFANTSLVCASSKGHKEVVEVLLDRGANLSCKDGDGFTPLMCASMGGHKEVVEVLLDRGADISAWSNGRRTSLMRPIKAIRR